MVISFGFKAENYICHVFINSNCNMTTNPRHHLNTRDPTIRAMIIEDYNAYGIRYVKKTYDVNGNTVRAWKQLQHSTGSLAPRSSLAGRNPVLSPKDIKKLERALLSDPFLTNSELAHLIGNKITPRAVGNYVKHSHHNFTLKMGQFDTESTFSVKHVEEGTAFIKKLKHIPLDHRVYVDETFVSASVHRKKGRFPKGNTFWIPQNRFYPRRTIISAIRHHSWACSSQVFATASMSTQQFEEFIITRLAPSLQEHDVVIWDRLGRSGRAKNPTALHYSPRARDAITGKGATLLFLPPSGKLLNPMELVFGDVKHEYDKLLQMKSRFVKPSTLSFDEIKQLWFKAEAKIQQTNIHRAFHERANGKQFEKVCREKGLW